MLTFRKALLASLFVLTVIYLLRSSHDPSPLDVQAAQDLPPELENEDRNAAPTETTPNSQVAVGPSSKPTSSSSSITRIARPESAGKGSPGQQTLSDTDKSLRARLAYQYPYDMESQFPAYIWQTWKTTPASGDFPENYRPGEASWTGKHPGFIHEVITDQVAVHLIKHLYASIPEVIDAYDSLPLPVLKADFFRYLILLARGGIYSDIDTTALKSVVDWIPEKIPLSSIGLVVGIEADPDREDWHEWYSRRIQFCQWTIQSKSGHPVLRDIVAHITEEAPKWKHGKVDNHNVVEFTGPALWTDKIFEYLNNEQYFDMSTSKGNITWREFTGMKNIKKVGDVVILPITSFSPGVGQMGAGEPDDPLAYVQHDFDGEKILED
ncbi:MAG: membrane-bound alpha-1,6- mannosyltransferase Initiation-specific [Trichoglossum hirsutum]|jgi:alpha 1,6-mannosyltransferase|nr:MAG: membrane-bound alpha-1,6- mannosyltransferase Initiation-specific [Trichoglossum hirsutum]